MRGHGIQVISQTREGSCLLGARDLLAKGEERVAVVDN